MLGSTIGNVSLSFLQHQVFEGRYALPPRIFSFTLLRRKPRV
jgi:hypothetical protein